MVDTLVLGTSAVRRAGSTPVTRTMKINLPGGVELTEQDKTLGLIVCLLALSVSTVGVVFVVAFQAYWAMELILMAIAWWFGATMVWLAEKYYHKWRG